MKRLFGSASMQNFSLFQLLITKCSDLVLIVKKILKNNSKSKLTTTFFSSIFPSHIINHWYVGITFVKIYIGAKHANQERKEIKYFVISFSTVRIVTITFPPVYLQRVWMSNFFHSMQFFSFR